MDNNNSIRNAGIRSSSNGRSDVPPTGVPPSANTASLHGTGGVAGFLFAAKECPADVARGECAAAAAVADNEAGTAPYAVIVQRISEACAPSSSSASAEDDPLQQGTSTAVTAVAGASMSSVSLVPEAAATMQQPQDSHPSPLSWPLSAPHSPAAAPKLGSSVDGGTPLSPSHVSAAAETVASPGVASSGSPFVDLSTAAIARPTDDTSSPRVVVTASASGLFVGPPSPPVTTAVFAHPAGAVAAASASAAARAAPPVRIAILPPKRGQEEVFHSPLLSPGAPQSPTAASPAAAATRSPTAVRSPVAAAAPTSLGDTAGGAPSLHMPSRCYSLFPPPSTIGSSAQLSPAQTTMSRSPISSRSPGMQTPQQQQEQEQKHDHQQQQELWQPQQQDQHHQAEQLVVEQLLQQQQHPLAPQHPVTCPSAEPHDASVAEDLGSPKDEQQLQQQLQQLHHSLLAQLSASSATAVDEAASAPVTAEAATRAAGLSSAVTADDDIDAAAVDMTAVATTTAASAPGATVVALITADKGAHDAKLEEPREVEEQGSAQQQQQQRQLRASSSSTAAAAAWAAAATVGAVAASTARGLPVVTSDAPFSKVDPGQQQGQQEHRQREEQKQQQEEGEKHSQEEYFPALFRSLSAASLRDDGTSASGDVAGSSNSSAVVGRTGPTFGGGININCGLPVSALSAALCCSGTAPPAGTAAAESRPAAGCAAALARLVAFPPLPQEEVRQSSRLDGQRIEKKRHSVAEDLLGKTAQAAVAAAAAAAGSGEWRKATDHDTVASPCSGAYSRGSMKSGFGYGSSSTSGRGNYSGCMTVGSSHSVSAHHHPHTSFEKSRNSRSYADLATVDSFTSGFSKLTGNSSSRRDEEPEEERHCSTGGWTTALVAEAGKNRRKSPAAISEKDRAALRAALLARQDYLRRFLQATQQALSALEGDSEKAVETDQPLSAVGSPASLQSSNTGASCRLSATCSTPLSPETAVSPSHHLPVTLVPSRGEHMHQQKQVNLLHQQAQKDQLQSRETVSQPSPFPTAALPRGAHPPLPSPTRRTAPSPRRVGVRAAPHVVAEAATGGGEASGTRTGRGLLGSDDRGRDEALIPSPSGSGGGRAAISAGGNVPLSPTETTEAAAAAAVAAKAVVAAAASLLEHQRQQAQKQQHQQQAPQQRGQQQQRLHHQQQPLQQKREPQCLPSLGPGMVSEETETESEQLRLLARVAHLSRLQADEGDATSSGVPTNDISSDAVVGAASDGAAASPTAFGGRAGIRSRTAPASSIDDKVMPGFLSFLCGIQESELSAADVEALSLLRRHGETILRAARTPYTCNPAATVAAAAAAGEALAALMRAGESASSTAAVGERRERPRVRFRDHRSQEQQEEEDEAKLQDHLETQEMISQPQEARVPEQEQHPPQQQQQHASQQQREVVCPMSPIQARMQLRRVLQLQQCNESEVASLLTASPASSPSPTVVPRDALINVVAAAAAAATTAGKCGPSDTTMTGRSYTSLIPGSAANYADHQTKTDEVIDEINSPVTGASHVLAAGVPPWAEGSTTRNAGVVTSSPVPWTAVSAPPVPQQCQPQQLDQGGEIMGLSPSAAVMGPLLHLTRIGGIAATLEQEQQHEHLRNASTLFMRPQRRTATLPCTAANVLFQSLDVQALLHLQCRCKPCAFYYNRKGCRNGMNCEFCHHEDHSKLTVKQWKKQQHKLSRQVNHILERTNRTYHYWIIPLMCGEDTEVGRMVQCREFERSAQARCLSIEEERTLANVAGMSISARSGGPGGPLFSGAGRQLLGTPPTPSDFRDATIPALSAFPLLWKDDESGSSSCGSALLLKSGGCSSRSNCASPLYGKRPEITSTNRCADRTARGAHIPSLTGHGFEQSGARREDSLQADATTAGESICVPPGGAGRGALAATEGEHRGSATAAVLAATEYAHDTSCVSPDFTTGS